MHPLAEANPHYFKLSDQWQELKTTWSNIQEKTAPLQPEETGRLRQLEDNFVHELEVLHDQFNREAFLAWQVGYSRATELIQKWHQILEKQDDEAAEIQANGELLEFTVNPFKNLGLMKAD
jgi:hypothetical protein